MSEIVQISDEEFKNCIIRLLKIHTGCLKNELDIFVTREKLSDLINIVTERNIKDSCLSIGFHPAVFMPKKDGKMMLTCSSGKIVTFTGVFSNFWEWDSIEVSEEFPKIVTKEQYKSVLDNFRLLEKQILLHLDFENSFDKIMYSGTLNYIQKVIRDMIQENMTATTLNLFGITPISSNLTINNQQQCLTGYIGDVEIHFPSGKIDNVAGFPAWQIDEMCANKGYIEIKTTNSKIIE